MCALERFEVIDEIGRGAQGITYRARDRETGELVAFKKLNLRDSTDWKAIELFEREGRALKSLAHAGIPKYIDAYHQLVGEGNEESFVLVQEYVEGQNLGVLIEQGIRMGAGEVGEFLSSMLDILQYLHGLARPVIHRDIKPSNIMRRADGRWVLIDFGAVQFSVESPSTERGAATVVGTTGYMPFEQILGVAVPASDLYALGATMVHVLSHRHPNDLPADESDHMRLLFAPYITASAEISGLLERLLEPLVDDRVQTAQEALLILTGALPAHREVGRGKQLTRTKNLNVAGVSKHGVAVAIAPAPMSGVMEVSPEAVSFRVARRGDAYTPSGYGQALFVIFGFFMLWLMTTIALIFLNIGFISGGLEIVAGFCLVVSWAVFNQYRSRPVVRLVVTRQFVETEKYLPALFLWPGWGKRRVLVKDIAEIGVEPVRTLFRRKCGFRVRLRMERGKDLYFGMGQTQEQSHWLALKVEEAIEVFEQG